MRTSLAIVAVLLSCGCDKGTEPAGAGGPTAAASAAAPANKPFEIAKPASPDAKHVVHVAMESKDHTTLVTALEAADYVYSLTNPGPFTVFAPTNAAFDKLPKGTVEGLLAPGKQEDLKNILKYHVAVSVYQTKDFKDGQTLAMANGAKTTLKVSDGKVSINDANVVASIPVSNGIVHVVDGVLLPPAK